MIASELEAINLAETSIQSNPIKNFSTPASQQLRAAQEQSRNREANKSANLTMPNRPTT